MNSARPEPSIRQYHYLDPLRNRCDGYKDCKDYSDEENCGALLSGDRRHPFLGLIGPIGCLVAALAIRVLLRSHQRRRLLHSNGETAAVAAATALEASNRRARFPEEAAGGGGADRFDDSLDASVAGSHEDRFPGNSPHWMDRVGAGISSSIAQMRILFTPNSNQAGRWRGVRWVDGFCLLASNE